jgi:hypothetical protein
LSWFVCTIGRSTPGNWDLCKQASAYGVPGGRRPPAEAEDHLLIWLAGRGYVAEAVVTGPPTVPRTNEEAPWPGGLYRFTHVVPMRVVIEVRKPISFPFVGPIQPDTGVSKSQLQRCMALISDSGAIKVSAAIREQAMKEAHRVGHDAHASRST